MKLGGATVGAALAVGVLVGGSGAARADEPAPWVVGVTDAQKSAAKQLLDKGNTLFVEHDYVAALEAYKQALAQWDHPSIRFNIVRCLIQLERPLEASDELDRALKYGAKPLEEHVYDEALAYQKLLRRQIGHIVVTCKQPGVQLSLDGKPLMTCPGTQEQRVAPGTHQLVAHHEGFLTRTIDALALGGEQANVDVVLDPLGETGKRVHRWATWKPWIVVGAGLTVAAVGGLIRVQAARDMDDYDRSLVAACLDSGCGPSHPLPASLQSQYDRARLESNLAAGVLAIGGAAAATGAVLLYLNRERLVYVPEHLEVAPHPGGATVGWIGTF